MNFVLVIDNQQELAENLVELLELSGISAISVSKVADVDAYLSNPDLCAVVANSLGLDGHIRTFAHYFKKKNEERNIELIVFGDADSNRNEDVIDHYMRLPLDTRHFITTAHEIVRNRRPKVA
jgi:DNA-binding NtrC family response regulator